MDIGWFRVRKAWGMLLWHSMGGLINSKVCVQTAGRLLGN
jgi:hypothetical protein